MWNQSAEVKHIKIDREYVNEWRVNPARDYRFGVNPASHPQPSYHRDEFTNDRGEGCLCLSHPLSTSPAHRDDKDECDRAGWKREPTGWYVSVVRQMSNK